MEAQQQHAMIGVVVPRVQSGVSSVCLSLALCACTVIFGESKNQAALDAGSIDAACTFICGNDSSVCPAESGCTDCSLNTDCDSQVCVGGNGQCMAEEAILYVDGSANMNGSECLFDTPCQTIAEAQAKVDLDRVTIMIREGGYPEAPLVFSTTVRVVGHEATIGASSPAVDSIVRVSGKSTVILEDLTIDAATYSAGITCSDANLEATRVRVENSGSYGVVLGSCGVKIEKSIVTNCGKILWAANTRFTIVNNFFVDSGDGLFFEDSNSFAESVLAFNTVANIDTNGQYGSGWGIECNSGDYRFAITHNIFTTQKPTTTGRYAIGGNCDVSYSLVDSINTVSVSMMAGPEPGVVPLFVQNGFDFHLQADSPGIDQGEPGNTLVDEDIDGEPRPQGDAPDIGADEVR